VVIRQSRNVRDSGTVAENESWDISQLTHIHDSRAVPQIQYFHIFKASNVHQLITLREFQFLKLGNERKLVRCEQKRKISDSVLGSAGNSVMSLTELRAKCLLFITIRSK
jgi:hypothetical protein